MHEVEKTFALLILRDIVGKVEEGSLDLLEFNPFSCVETYEEKGVVRQRISGEIEYRIKVKEVKEVEGTQD